MCQVGRTEVLTALNQRLTGVGVTSPLRWDHSEADVLHCLPDFPLKAEALVTLCGS